MEIKDATAANVKAENPALYNEIIGFVEIDTIKAEAYAKGVQSENERIIGIEALETPDNQEVIKANKFDSSKNSGDVAALVLADQKVKSEAATAALKADTDDLASKSDQIDGSEITSTDAKDAAIANMVSAANKRANVRA